MREPVLVLAVAAASAALAAAAISLIDRWLKQATGWNTVGLQWRWRAGDVNAAADAWRGSPAARTAVRAAFGFDGLLIVSYAVFFAAGMLFGAATMTGAIAAALRIAVALPAAAAVSDVLEDVLQLRMATSGATDRLALTTHGATLSKWTFFVASAVVCAFSLLSAWVHGGQAAA